MKLNIPQENIWNFDETNLSDDPGQKKVICKRGMKYCERIMNFSKSAISLMLSANAAGEILLPYVVYKAEHLWSTWTENGPPGTRYNRTKSGWFDMKCFEDWFVSLFLPKIKQQKGKKVVIGDNLSSHININVLRMCEENEIAFICLPPHSTHLTQPLDVAFFSPMKKAWRKILDGWKSSDAGSSYRTLPKDVFPALLKRMLEALRENEKENLQSGFRKCSVYPVDKDQLLRRLPQATPVDVNEVSEAFLDHLIQKRGCSEMQSVQRKR